jgi:hypothetical protein
LKARRLNKSEKEKPTKVLLIIRFFHGLNNVLNSVEIEKKYGRKIKKLMTASPKLCRVSQ